MFNPQSINKGISLYSINMSANCTSPGRSISVLSKTRLLGFSHLLQLFKPQLDVLSKDYVVVPSPGQFFMFYNHSAPPTKQLSSPNRSQINGGWPQSRSRWAGGSPRRCGRATGCRLPTGIACSGCAYARRVRTRPWAFRGRPGVPNKRSPCTKPPRAKRRR